MAAADGDFAAPLRGCPNTAATIRWRHLYTILIGAVIGALARMIKPGADPMGWILTILLGIAGAWVGSYLGGMLGLHGGIIGFVVSIVCAIVLLAIYEAIRKKS
jgi:uncharacterized membrane protein YeaQ/YmgE (transglycosylase-associated protein family)